MRFCAPCLRKKGIVVTLIRLQKLEPTLSANTMCIDINLYGMRNLEKSQTLQKRVFCIALFATADGNGKTVLTICLGNNALLQMQWLHQLLLIPRQDTMYSYFFDMESDDTSFGEFQAYMFWYSYQIPFLFLGPLGQHEQYTKSKNRPV